MAKKQITPDYVLFVDWETTGATFGGDSSKEFQGISIGAVVAKTDTWEEVDNFYSLVKFDSSKFKWTEEAAKIHGLSMEKLEKEGYSQEDVATAFLEFIFKYFGTGKVMFGGHNEEFDRRFTNQLFNSVGIEFSIEKSGQFETHIPVHHVTINTASLGFVTFRLFKSDLLFTALGTPERAEHNALDDARAALNVCATIKAVHEAGMKYAG